MVSIDQGGRLPNAGPKVVCFKCLDVIQSMFRHDFKWCSCKSIAVDGGGDYLKMSYKTGAQYEVLQEEVDNEEVIRTSEVIDGGRTITQNHSGNGDNIAGNIVRNKKEQLKIKHQEAFDSSASHQAFVTKMKDQVCSTSKDTTEKAKLLRARMMEELVPLIDPVDSLTEYGGSAHGCLHDNIEARALVVILLSKLSYAELLELNTGLSRNRLDDRRNPSFFSQRSWGELKIGDFTIRPGGLLDGMPDGWRLDN